MDSSTDMILSDIMDLQCFNLPKSMYPNEANIENSGFESIHIHSETKVIKKKSETNGDENVMRCTLQGFFQLSEPSPRFIHFSPWLTPVSFLT